MPLQQDPTAEALNALWEATTFNGEKLKRIEALLEQLLEAAQHQHELSAQMLQQAQDFRDADQRKHRPALQRPQGR